MHKFCRFLFLSSLLFLTSNAQSDLTGSDSAYYTDEDLPSSSDEPTYPLWMEAYTEGKYEIDEDPDASLFVNIGKRLPLPFSTDIYGKCKISLGNQEYYWNNRTDLGIGIRVIYNSFLSITSFVEVLGGYYMQSNSIQKDVLSMYNSIDSINGSIDKIENISKLAYYGLKVNSDSLFKIENNLKMSRDTLYQKLSDLEASPNGFISEYRGGLTFWKGWGQDYSVAPSFHFWGNIYGELVGSILRKKIGSDRIPKSEQEKDSLFLFPRRDTLILNGSLYLNPEIGITANHAVLGSFVLSLSVNFWLDALGDWETNRLIAGPVIHYIPFKSISLDINAGYYAGIYLNTKSSEPKPQNGIFSTFRAGFSFWYGLGI